MAGTLTISTLSDGTYSTSSTNCIQGSAKAWVSFNGASGASPVIRASFNISSVTRTGTGAYTINFTTAFVDANYTIATCTMDGPTSSMGLRLASSSGTGSPNGLTTSSVQLYNGYTSAAIDGPYLYAVFNR